MSWLDKVKSTAANLGKKISKQEQEDWFGCTRCQEIQYPSKLDQNLYVCLKCDLHYRIDGQQRIRLLVNPDSFQERDVNLVSLDTLKFKDKKKYKDRIKHYLKDGNPKDAIICGTGKIGEHEVEICSFDFGFMGGSMGSVVGEKITRSIERAIKNQSALIIVSCSGGARMQEGILSLMQMAKTVSSLQQLSEAGIPYISLLTDPTTGGVSASFALLGDVILAEPGATIGFAGPRVIKQTIQQELPDGFQTSEFLLEHGLIDQVVHRRDLKTTLENLLSLLKNKPIPKPRAELKEDKKVPPSPLDKATSL